jgi:hypothetical protein
MPTRALFLTCCVAALWARPGNAQSGPYERTFAQSKVQVDKALKELQPSTSGRLPVLDGFTNPGDRPLDQFQRGYYQCTIQTSPTPTGGTLVRVSARITAWYADPHSTASAYQVLSSNGRLENDFLDRLEEALGGKSSSSGGVATGSMGALKATAPARTPVPLGNSVSHGRVASLATQKAVVDKHVEELTKEAKGLEEILRSQAHPDNLAAVKKSGTPVLASPIEGAKVLFLASAEDEFEILDSNATWVHIRISGLSRGWIRRSSLEMPEASTSNAGRESAAPNAEYLQVKDEQIATFPGNWEPLRGQTVKILTIQKTGANFSTNGSQAKLEFAKSLFAKEYAELTRTSTTAAGVVLIFDSEDGGMAAATLPALQQWKAGTLSDQAFWRRCFFDPPEAFISQTRQ